MALPGEPASTSALPRARVRRREERDTLLLPQEAAAKVNKFVHLEDRKRALCR